MVLLKYHKLDRKRVETKRTEKVDSILQNKCGGPLATPISMPSSAILASSAIHGKMLESGSHVTYAEDE